MNNISISYRKSIRLKNYDYTSSGAYFLTICSNRYQGIFGEIIAGEGGVVDCIPNDLGQIVIEE
jgi:putative transposase